MQERGDDDEGYRKLRMKSQDVRRARMFFIIGTVITQQQLQVFAPARDLPTQGPPGDAVLHANIKNEKESAIWLYFHSTTRGRVIFVTYGNIRVHYFRK